MKKILFSIFYCSILFGNEAQIALEYAILEEMFNNLNSCSNNNFQSCDKISKMPQIIHNNEAKEYINKRCNEKNMAACYTISTITNDFNTKYNSLRLACQNQFELACTYLVSQFENNSNKALKILKQQCDDEKNMNSCIITALYYKGFLDKENALKYSKLACDNSFYNSCLIQSELLISMNEKQKSYNILENTCYKNYEPACFEAANINFKNGNFKISKKFLEHSCMLGNELSCSKINGL